MNKIVLGLTVAAIAAFCSIAPATAQGSSEEVKELQAFCHALVDSGTFPDLVFGECMAFNAMSEEGFKVALCGYLRDNGLLEDEGFDSFSQCVQNIDY